MVGLDDTLRCSIATGSDAVEGHFDREVVEFVGIVAVEPFADFSMIGMGGIGSGFKHFVEAWDAATILRRAVTFTGDEAGIGGAGIAGAHVADNEAVLPVVAKLVNVVIGVMPGWITSRRRMREATAGGGVPQFSSIGRP